MIYAIDFDGTIIEHVFPKIGNPVPLAFETMKKMIDRGDQLILYTMRSGKYLDEAVEFCRERGVEFWGVNENPEQKEWTNSPKVYAHFYIDDASLGAPLIYPSIGRPYYNWKVARRWIFAKQPTVQVLNMDEDVIKKSLE